jgi:hypothetical protein
VVDELCPVRQVAAMAVDEVYGIESHLLNDDRLGWRSGDQRVRG